MKGCIFMSSSLKKNYSWELRPAELVKFANVNQQESSSKIQKLNWFIWEYIFAAHIVYPCRLYICVFWKFWQLARGRASQLEGFCIVGKARGSSAPSVAIPPQERNPNLVVGRLNFVLIHSWETQTCVSWSGRREHPPIWAQLRRIDLQWAGPSRGGWWGWSWRPWWGRGPPSRWRCSSRRWSRRWPRRQLALTGLERSHCWWQTQSWGPWRRLLSSLPDFETWGWWWELFMFVVI